MKSIIVKSLTVAMALLTVATYADLIVYEPFNYAIGTSNADPDGGVNGGQGLPYTNIGGDPAGTSVGLRNSWTVNTVVTTGLSYGPLIVNNNALFLNGGQHMNGGQVWLYRNMTVDPYGALRGHANGFGANGTSIWGSMLLQLGGIGASDRLAFYIFGGDDPNGYNRIKIATYGGGNWGLSLENTSAGVAPGSSTTVNQSVSPTTDVTLLLWKHEFYAGTETFSLWFNPDLSSPGTPNYVLTTGREVGNWVGIGWDTRNGAGSIIDELRVGTTMADVLPVPEPSTVGLGLAGLGLLGVLRRRSR